MIALPPEVEKKLITLAEVWSVDPASLIASWVAREMPVTSGSEENDSVPCDDGVSTPDPDALRRAVAALLDRTPEQRRAARQNAIEKSRPRIELPPGVSLFDVLPVVRGEETDEEVLQALKEQS
jgi:hypothetical protein